MRSDLQQRSGFGDGCAALRCVAAAAGDGGWRRVGAGFFDAAVPEDGCAVGGVELLRIHFFAGGGIEVLRLFAGWVCYWCLARRYWWGEELRSESCVVVIVVIVAMKQREGEKEGL